MHYSTLIGLTLGSLAAADYTVTLVSLDNINRTVYWTPNVGLPEVPPTIVEPGKNATVELFPWWCGNAYAVNEGKPNVPGMLAELCFGGYGDSKVFYDVSAIVDGTAFDGVQSIFPADEPHEPISGCERHWPCENAYWHWNDTQTKSAPVSDIIVTLGSNHGGVATRELDRILNQEGVQNYPREAVLNPFWKPQ